MYILDTRPLLFMLKMALPSLQLSRMEVNSFKKDMILFLLHFLEIHKGFLDQVKEIWENPCGAGLVVKTSQGVNSPWYAD